MEVAADRGRYTKPREVTGVGRSERPIRLASPLDRRDEGAMRDDREEKPVGILTDDMRRVVGEQKLGYVATVCPDGTPNLSPKGTVAVWDDDRLVFADIASPRTVANLRRNSALEVNVVDPIARKGWRFKGRAAVHDRGEIFDEVVAWYRRNGTASPIRSVVLVEVERALPLVSPAYDRGATEADVRRRWEDHYLGKLGWGRQGTA
jgi:predicted pyridoxine 5'-phosphate oxidase superfamily flavin-nucleotide-binding protein